MHSSGSPPKKTMPQEPSVSRAPNSSACRPVSERHRRAGRGRRVAVGAAQIAGAGQVQRQVHGVTDRLLLLQPADEVLGLLAEEFGRFLLAAFAKRVPVGLLALLTEVVHLGRRVVEEPEEQRVFALLLGQRAHELGDALEVVFLDRRHAMHAAELEIILVRHELDADFPGRIDAVDLQRLGLAGRFDDGPLVFGAAVGLGDRFIADRPLRHLHAAERDVGLQLDALLGQLLADDLHALFFREEHGRRDHHAAGHAAAAAVLEQRRHDQLAVLVFGQNLPTAGQPGQRERGRAGQDFPPRRISGRFSAGNGLGLHRWAPC